MFGIGATELVIILVLALVIFGPGKLPDVGKAIGRSIREFKKATTAADEDDASSASGTSQAGNSAAVRESAQSNE